MSILEEFILKSNRINNIDELFIEYRKTLEYFGFDKVVYSLITDHYKAGLQAGHAIMGNYPQDFLKHYMEKGYQKLDPVPKQAFKSVKPFAWKSISEERELNKDELLVMNEADDAKLLSGVGIPLYGANGEIAGVGIASSERDLDLNIDILSMLRAITHQFHLVYLDLCKRPNNDNKIALTNREREILLWYASGKKDGDIADIIGISYDSVRFHSKNIFKKLDVNDRVFAVVKAIRLGLITPNYVFN
ncbi:MAG: LuxR family transcriptional regulator [Rickettsiales bacterium]|nr:LuxR family transcriptional regulator [Rickettsiales bacterium]